MGRRGTPGLQGSRPAFGPIIQGSPPARISAPPIYCARRRSRRRKADNAMHSSCLRFLFGFFVSALVPQVAASAEEAMPVSLGGRYIGDMFYVDEGRVSDRAFMVHAAEAAVEMDLEQIAGARGLSAGLHVLGTAGGRPNEAAGTLQGVDNVEVEQHRLRLYQAWVEQVFAGGTASLRLGLTDLNADFYQNDFAGLLLGPAFGIGSELAATGPNGPSTFPSTALTARLAVQLSPDLYGKFAIINAKAGVLGEPAGVDFSMRDGALLIGEVGTGGRAKLALGAWGYTERQPDIYKTEANGTPVRRTAAGAYLLVDYRLTDDTERGVHAFLRVGRSDGVTTPFRGGFQAGFLVNGVFAGRPDGQLSLGIQQGELSRGFRRMLLDQQGVRAAPSEWGVELTYADQLTSFLSVQPDVQFIRRSYAEGGHRSTLVFAIRTMVSFGDF